MKNKYTNLLMFSMLGLVTPHMVNAQEADEFISFEEIVVTAQKREQRLIEVPMSITTMTGTEMQQRGLDTLQELSFAVPGLTMREDGPGSYQIFMRGIANQYGGTSGALVSVYQDESPLTLNGFDNLPTRIMDIDRVEVLKGPQGTLYGQGSVGGTLRYITKDPDLSEREGRLEGELESVAEGAIGGGLTGIVNLPIVEDKFAVRVAGSWQSGGGWQDQPEAGIENGNGTELNNLRVKALWQVTDELSAKFTFISYHAETELGQGYEQPDRTVFVAIDPATTLIPKIWDYELYNMTLTYDFGFAELLSSTTYTDMSQQYPISYYGGPETIYGGIYEGWDHRFVPGDIFTQELRLTSADDGSLHWTVGAFYSDMQRSLHAEYSYLYGAFLAENLIYDSHFSSESYALFGDVSYQVTDRLEIGAGVRYFEDSQKSELVPSPTQSGTFDSIDPRFYASYALNDNMNIYATVAKGFRSGGFNSYDADTGVEYPDYGPEKIWSYEVGFKGSSADGSLYVDLAAYYMDYSDMLRRGIVVTPESGATFLLSNIGRVEVYGFEGAIAWKATDNLSFDASVTILDSEVVEISGTDATNEVGDPTDYVPDYSFTVGALYEFDWGQDMPGFIRINYSYRDKMPYVDRSSFPAENVPQYSDAIGLLDARIGVTIDNVDLELYAQNLTNENKYIDPYHGWNNANRTRPRTVGIKAGMDF
ncbi:TonB-dependent receptor [Emcibacter sp.]|uniref:TonB-dependent receptor n=1 Tax=Emcibacter sp. TaxID=1979954 RepID=UPI003A92E6C3